MSSALTPGPVVVLAYDGVAADESGVLVEILGAAGIRVVIASVRAEPVTSYHGRLVPTTAAEALGPCGALIVPGGMGVQAASRNPRLLQAIAALAATSIWLGATSTGSVLLAAADVLNGSAVTTHWLATDLINQRGVTLAGAGYVEDGRVLTASGSASTAQLGFRLVGALVGVGAEAEARARYRPAPTRDLRYQRRGPWWRTIGRRFVEVDDAGLSGMDPAGYAELVLLDLDLGEDPDREAGAFGR